MTYVDTLTFTQALAGSQLTIQRTIEGDPWSVEYRENSAVLAWNGNDTVLAWNADDSTLVWDSPPYLPWPGQITVKNSIYDFRVIAGQANTQGVVSELTMTVDAPDLDETLYNVAISAGGTRPVPILPFNVFKGVHLTLLNDGGTAVTAKQEDLNPVLKPLLRCYDSALAGTAGHVNARYQGY
jgi:hypothetical protein